MLGEWAKTWADKSNINCVYFQETTSTNDLAKDYDYKSLDPVLFVTEHQTKGRGRGSNTWTDAQPGKALLTSWSFGLEEAPQPITTPLVGLAVISALEQTLNPRNLSLKAPNDIYIGSKKAGGLLVEAVSQGNHRLIIGFGLNVYQPAPLDTAATLEGHCQVPIDENHIHEFLSTLLVEFTNVLAACSSIELPLHARKDLARYLNKNSMQKEPVLSVEADGSIRTQTGLIRWTSL